MIIGTAGHIDHGKTSLVKWLTGVDTDRLPEEKKRGITIDLGFAYTRNKENELIGFVDVPGHEKFVHTMVAGAVGIDYGLLVIAADDGVMQQTIEHLRILELLGVNHLCVAMTKIDMVDQQHADKVHQEITELLLQTRYQSVTIFRVSNVTGQGINELKDHLFHVSLPLKNQQSFFRLAIDRVFVSKGMGVTITGAVQAGSVTIGDQLLLMPDGISVKVRSIHAQNQSVDHASLGARCGIVLTGVDLDQVTRGQWLVGKELTQEVSRFDAWIEMPMDAKQRIRDGEILLLHHGTDHTSARTILLNQKEVLPGQTAWVQLVLQKKLSMCWNDRFILRDMSARYSLGGGKVLDIFPPERGRKSVERLELLDILVGDNPSQVIQRIVSGTRYPVSMDVWSRVMNQSIPTLQSFLISSQVHDMVSAGEVFVMDKSLLEEMQNKILAFFQESSQAVGIDPLRGLFKPKVDKTLFKLILTEMVQRKQLFLIGSKYAISNQGVVFSPQEKILWDKVVLLLENDPLNPPPIRNIAQEMGIAETLLQSVFSKAMAQELLYYVGNHVYYSSKAFRKIAQFALDIFIEKKQISLIEFKNRLQIGRNRVVLIIETFDKMGFTHRIVRKDPKSAQLNDFRIIKNKAVLLEN
jgi:selenocysteine-specific elongation factor